MMALRNRYAVTESRGRFSRVTVTALPSTSRRVVLGTGLAAGAGLLQAAAAAAMDYKQALARKEARRAKLRNSAGDIKTSGKDSQIFKSSEYEVGEEARTPNVHSRQNEGAKTQENV